MITKSRKKSQEGKALKKIKYDYINMSINYDHNFQCKGCNYKTKNKSDWRKHCQTKKHLRIIGGNVIKNAAEKESHVCETCGKSYKYRSGLSRHMKSCGLGGALGKEDKKILEHQQNQIETLQNLLEKTIESQKDTLNSLMTKVGNTTNNYNNRMTINLFLNEECKNAMNLTDFVNSLQLSLDDLAYTKDNGYVKGITNIFVKNLQDLNPTERPIHCSDRKRLQFYVKDENKWEQDNKHSKINKSIESITQKQIQKIKEWEDSHPNWNTNEQGTDSYMRMIKEIMGNSENQKIPKFETIKKELGDTIDLGEIMDEKINVSQL